MTVQPTSDTSPHFCHLFTGLTLPSVPCIDGYELTFVITSHMSRDGLSNHCHAHNSVPCTPWCHPPIEHMHFIFYLYHITIFSKNVFQFLICHAHWGIIYSHFDNGWLRIILELDMFTKHTQNLLQELWTLSSHFWMTNELILATFVDIIAVHVLHLHLW